MKLLCGSHVYSFTTNDSDQVYLFNQELECQHSYLWNATSSNFMACIQAGIEVDTCKIIHKSPKQVYALIAMQESACRNHIRVYKKIPSQPSVLLVCGTQGGISPQCRTCTGTVKSVNSCDNDMLRLL